MPQLISRFDFDRAITTREVLPFTLTFTNIPSQAGNTVTIARRIDYSDYTNYLAGVASTFEDISSKTSVSLNVVTVTNIWAAATPAAGQYAIKVVLHDATGTVSDEEMNVYIKVIAS